MPTVDDTDPGRRAQLRVDVASRTVDALVRDVDQLRVTLTAHTSDTLAHRAGQDVALADIRARVDQLTAAIAQMRADPTPRAEGRMDAAESLRDQDRRLLMLRVALVLIPTLAALASPFLAARDVTIPPAAVSAIEAAIRAEIAADSAQPPSPAAAVPVPDPATFGPPPPP